jgi:hypothetical protein
MSLDGKNLWELDPLPAHLRCSGCGGHDQAHRAALTIFLTKSSNGPRSSTKRRLSSWNTSQTVRSLNSGGCGVWHRQRTGLPANHSARPNLLLWALAGTSDHAGCQPGNRVLELTLLPTQPEATTIAAAADDHLGATVRAQEQPSGCGLILLS